jgi:hypothetical protein
LNAPGSQTRSQKRAHASRTQREINRAIAFVDHARARGAEVALIGQPRRCEICRDAWALFAANAGFKIGEDRLMGGRAIYRLGREPLIEILETKLSVYGLCFYNL